jgi:hypothetical protein
MTSNLMDTEKGGEQTQYEGEHSDMMPHKQEAGQLGGTYPYNLLPLSHTITFPSCNPLLPFSSSTNTDVSTASAVQGGSTSQPTSTSEIEQDNKKTDEPNTVGISKADKIRYGQSIQEGGMGRRARRGVWRPVGRTNLLRRGTRRSRGGSRGTAGRRI